jgi:hypothetical protein
MFKVKVSLIFLGMIVATIISTLVFQIYYEMINNALHELADALLIYHYFS